jgi:hypothetical protein
MSARRRWLMAAAIVAVAALAVAIVLSSHPSSRRRAPAVTSPPTRSVAGPPAPARPAPAGQAFGVNVNLLFNDFSYTPSQIAAQLRAVRATGATLARSDALWEATEPRAPVNGGHRYDWSFDDLIAGSLASAGLTWLPIIDYTAPWAQSIPGHDHSPPRSDADYAAYAAAFTARYGSGGSFWRSHPALTAQPVTAVEIWNEPDNGQFWTPAPDARSYATLYLAARGAIDGVDPSMRVIVGGLTAPSSFLPAMVQAEPALRGHIDGVAIHPYGPPAVVASKVRAARATLGSLVMGSVPLYVTEFGWTTEPRGAVDYAPAPRRPAYIVNTLTELAHLGCGMADAVLYTWLSPQRNPRDGQDWYGIANPADPTAATADTAAFAAGVHAAPQASPSPPATPCGG